MIFWVPRPAPSPPPPDTMLLRRFATPALLGGIGCLCLSLVGHAAPTASFDCAAARAPIERLICSDDALAGLDAAVGKAFAARRQALADTEQPAALEEQRQWLRQRLAACTVPASGAKAPPAALACLIGLYRDRLAALTP